MTAKIDIPYVNLALQHQAIKKPLLAAVERVLDHGQFILGPEVAQFEDRVAKLLGAGHVVGVGNGTDALVLGLRLAGVRPGDEVITVAHSFVATASAISLVGATPVFVDIDERTMLMNPNLIEGAITSRTKAILPVHLNGFACELESIEAVCRRHGLALIEDCAQALGAKYHGRCVGTFGIGCGSLHALKVLSACGDGGFMVLPKGADIERLRWMRNIGLVDRDHCAIVAGNSRLDTLHAAMLLVKLELLDGWIKARRAHAAAYREALAGKVVLPPEDHGEAVYSAFVIRHPRRDALADHLRARGIETKVHYPIPIHKQSAFGHLRVSDLPVTDKVISEILSLPIAPELSEQDRNRVISAILTWA